jgi:hypothetical protein
MFGPTVIHVHLAVQLDPEPLFDTRKIENVRPYAVLAAKLASVHLGVFQCDPKCRLGRS